MTLPTVDDSIVFPDGAIGVIREIHEEHFIVEMLDGVDKGLFRVINPPDQSYHFVKMPMN